MVQNWKIFSPFGLSLYDAFKDNQDVKDLIQHGLLSLTKRYVNLKQIKLQILSKVFPEHVGFALLRSMIGSENVSQPPNQSDSKKANGDLVTAFSRA